ncbi:MAG: hypothetical protein HKN50_13055 [Gammaproteobacteria bacterium]|nr:hypothetical protein [Gammaproteobacteria bacterium]
MKRNNFTDDEMYGVSRIDDQRHYTHAWRVSLSRRGKRHVKNFPDKKYQGKAQALLRAKEFRDQLLAKYPPLSRREFCDAKRRNNRTGITGVYKYRKTYQLSDGTIKERWYWEANWPGPEGDSVSKAFSVARFGEQAAKHMAMHAREQGLQTVKGTFWAAARGNALLLAKPANEAPLKVIDVHAG